MKKFVVLMIAVFLIFLIYLGIKKSPNDNVLEPVTIALAAQNQSGETGQAILTEVDGQVKVTMNLTPALADVLQPAHIHRGTCVVLGEPVYTLSSLADGASETTITSSLDALKANFPLAINVHKSVTEAGTYVACGDIELE